MSSVSRVSGLVGRCHLHPRWYFSQGMIFPRLILYVRVYKKPDEKQLTGQASSASETASSAAIVVSSPLRSGLSSHAGCSRCYSPNHRHFPSTGNINYDHQYFRDSSSPRNHHTPHRQSQVSHIPGPCRGCSRRSRRRSGSQL